MKVELNKLYKVWNYIKLPHLIQAYFQNQPKEIIASIHKSLGLIFNTPKFQHLKIHNLFIQCPINAFQEKLEFHF